MWSNVWLDPVWGLAIRIVDLGVAIDPAVPVEQDWACAGRGAWIKSYIAGIPVAVGLLAHPTIHRGARGAALRCSRGRGGRSLEDIDIAIPDIELNRCAQLIGLDERNASLHV